MTPAARLATIMEALTEIWSVERPADMVLSAFFRARRFIGAKDRAAMAGAVYRILRSQSRLSWHLARADFPPEPRSLALADIVLNEGAHPEFVDRLCDGSRYAPDTLSMHERDMVRGLVKDGRSQRLAHPDMPDEVRLECPEWAAALLQEAFGDRTEAVLESLLHPAPLDLRVNRLKADRNTLLAQLQAMDWAAEAGLYTPDSIRLHKRPNLNAHPALQTGLADIQDEGSQLVALAVAAKPGMRVLDFCAGAGGKTLALAAQMENKGRIVASDVLAKRLQRSSERLKRAGVQNVELHPIVSENDPWLKRHKAGFDRVLVDAPCSGTGTWRRNPESRWRQLGPGLDELVPLQDSILTSAARLVKPGGRLIYATCSLLPVENGRQVEAFLEKNNDYSLLPIDSVWQDEEIAGPAGDAMGCLSLDPAAHGTDGFFAAVLERRTA